MKKGIRMTDLWILALGMASLWVIVTSTATYCKFSYVEYFPFARNASVVFCVLSVILVVVIAIACLISLANPPKKNKGHQSNAALMAFGSLKPSGNQQ